MIPRRNSHISFNKYLRTLILVFFISIIGGYEVFAQSSVSYYVEIEEENWNSLYVALTIQNNVNDQLLCQIPKWSTVFPTVCDFHSRIYEFEAKGDMGQALNVTELNSNSRLIDCQKSSVIIVSYKIKISPQPISGIKLDESFASMDCAATFMSIRELMNVPIQLVVRVPHGWKLATGLAKTEAFEYFAQNYHQLAQNFIYMAPFFDTYFTFQNRNFFLILDGPRNFKVNKLLNIIQKLVKESYRIFGSFPFDQYMFIFKNIDRQLTVDSQAFSNCSVYYVPNRMSKDDLIELSQSISSNLFKTWNGTKFSPIQFQKKNYQLVPRSVNLWFILGVSDYFGMLSLVRSGIIGKDDFIRHQVHQINQILRKENYHDFTISELSYDICEFDYSEVSDILKLKGQVLGFLLDIQIRSSTNNTKSLIDVFQFLNTWFGSSNIGYTDEQILQTINSVTSADLTLFFDKYVNGSVPFPTKEVFAKAGIFIESRQDTLPDFGPISISENDNQILEVSDLSPLAFAGLKVGDKLLSINDQKLQHPVQFDRFVDSLKVGQDTDITVQRQGLVLMLSAKVSGKICQVFKLIDANPKNELQQKIQQNLFLSDPPAKNNNQSKTASKK